MENLKNEFIDLKLQEKEIKEELKKIKNMIKNCMNKLNENYKNSGLKYIEEDNSVVIIFEDNTKIVLTKELKIKLKGWKMYKEDIEIIKKNAVENYYFKTAWHLVKINGSETYISKEKYDSLKSIAKK